MLCTPCSCKSSRGFPAFSPHTCVPIKFPVVSHGVSTHPRVPVQIPTAAPWCPHAPTCRTVGFQRGPPVYPHVPTHPHALLKVLRGVPPVPINPASQYKFSELPPVSPRAPQKFPGVSSVSRRPSATSQGYPRCPGSLGCSPVSPWCPCKSFRGVTLCPHAPRVPI